MITSVKNYCLKIVDMLQIEAFSISQAHFRGTGPIRDRLQAESQSGASSNWEPIKHQELAQLTANQIGGAWSHDHATQRVSNSAI